MSFRCLLGSSLLTLSALLPAQAPQKPAQPAAPVLVPGAAPADGKQDPEKRDPKAVTPEDRVRQLTAEKARLEQEMQFVLERANQGWMAQMLKSKLGNRKLDFKSIDAGTSAGVVVPQVTEAPKASPFKRARMMSPDEMKGLDAAVVMTVAGMPVRKDAIDQLIGYLNSYVTVGSEEMRQNQAVFSVLQAEVAHAAFQKGDAEAAAKITGIQKELEGGADFAELAKKHSQGPNADKGGNLEKVTRRSFHGLILEYHAFNTAPGKVSPVFRTAMGYNLLKVEKFEKGETKEQDTVVASLITIGYDADQAKVRQAQNALASSQVDIAVRDEVTMKLLPAMFRPVEASPPAGQLPGSGVKFEDADKQVKPVPEKKDVPAPEKKQ